MWFMGYMAATAGALIILFRKFIFSNGMLYSNDIITFGMFVRSFLREHIAAGFHIPYWNPYTCCGLPFIDAIHSGIFYPLTVVDLIGNLYRAPGYNFILHYFLAGVFAYLAARRFRLSPIASSVAGVIYAFSPCIISWTAPGHDGKLYVATWFPLAVLFLDRILREQRWRDVGFLGLVYGVIILTPHLQLAYYAGWAMAVIVLWTIVGHVRRRAYGRSLKSVAMVLAAMIIALSVSAVQFLPAVRYLTEDSPRAQQQRGPRYASYFSLHAEEVVSVAIPEFCGRNQKGGQYTYWGKNSFKDNSESVGTAAFFLAVLAAFFVNDKRKYLWLTLAAGVLAYAVGPVSPIHRLIVKVVPMADAMEAPSGSMFLLVFSVAILGGLVVHEVQRGTLRRPKWLAPVLVLTPLLWSVAALTAILNGPWLIRAYCFAFNPAILPQVDELGKKWPLALANLPALRFGLVLGAVVIAAIALVLWLSLHKQRRASLLWLVPVLVLASILPFDSRFITVTDPAGWFENNPAADYIVAHQGLWRTIEPPYLQGKMRLSFHRIYEVGGTHGKEPTWYRAFIGNSNLRGNILNPNVANLSSGRYIISYALRRIDPRAFGPEVLDTVWRNSDWVVLENRNCFPRAFLAGNYRVLESDTAINKVVLADTSDLRSVVLLEEEPGGTTQPDTSDQSEATITDYTCDSISISVNTPTDQLLVLTDNWYRSWHAYVDGVERPVLRAYGVFRAVEVPAGSKAVVFKYHSTLQSASNLLTLAGLGLVLACCVVPSTFRRFRRDRPPT